MTQQYLTVTALTKYLKRKFDADPYLGRIYLTGEISNFRLRVNAHQYFSLKDDGAKISAIMFKSAFQKLKFQPKEGMKVLVVGRISLYENNGAYQIYIDHMEPDGIGALYQALAELKEKLAKEGLFNKVKRKLPLYPKRIAVITSPSGAVIRDIITTVHRRYPIAQLVLFPTLVQGEQAADDIVRNIERAEKIGNFDTIILGRGGGSIEDLWPFNEESVARAIYQSKIPIISSVGHETDTTIADLVADVRAATPTAAAEMAVPVLSEELLKIKERQERLAQAFLYLVQQQEEHFKHLKNSYVFKQPERLYEGQTLKLDQVTQRLQQLAEAIYHQKQLQTQSILNQLYQQAPLNQIKEKKQYTSFLNKNLTTATQQIVKDKRKQFISLVQQLDLLSPLKIMGRGYSYTTKNEKVIRSAQEVKVADQLTIHYTDGMVKAVVESKTSLEKEF
ncbi:exodeoxyribonuclease 7 large subunit XseA [Melissococcus plutonius]|uniref:Exodeoxyribonuclease 7 large subunit n=1 Tax=Melissococcus plutonius (strain ATCC 35311 / DSM 29964 / CIP 104052 / LMG 20360 / NCIMB 702443) TaxID=940190 RepID=F3Y9P5_MELPT|nr:exodeoxyribonuclease VII large subunit [Melissococcus plutonius]AIM24761.1 exodeoxyribonuclease 7 large subunit XseA [Melissococcus plutonius S1]KMT24872.1 exodeoxyribonuclease 7 large subunit XseA [Melissococcus plutonius]KMT26509.1 exodeoxyribonuclease 7 large subunit XseA [Melissococcus plutonius]KMT27759.1 exodeoxyribonuclease 7 large subunit XseA [Melissococcus plutonius]KMT29531.1 exodeoxyribonuclease 7 large subunit XseA [Melissococcus plutonius]